MAGPGRSDQLTESGLRDSRAGWQYFDNAVRASSRTAQRHEREMSLPPEKHRYPAFRAVAANGAMSARSTEFSASYSRGADRQQLRLVWNSWLDAAEIAAHEKRAEDAVDLRAAQDEPGSNFRLYLSRLWLVASAHALDVEDAAFDRVAAAVRPLWSDRLVRSLIAVRRPQCPVRDELWFPRRFGALTTAFSVAEPSRADAVARHLHSWYANMRGVDWWDGHQYLQKLHYVGYWAFEAAGVVAALRIDDTSLIDQEFYPADIVAR